MCFAGLFCIGCLAVFWDFCTGRIPNVLIGMGLAGGLAWQWRGNGPPGILYFCLGAAVPIAVLGVLHYFNMIGAGDLKYFMVIGGFLGADRCLRCMFLSFLIAAVFSLAAMLKYRILKKRLILLFQYIKEYLSTGIWKPYLAETAEKEEAAYLHLAFPIFLGSMLTIGGWI